MISHAMWMNGRDFLEGWHSHPASHAVPLVVISAGRVREVHPPLGVRTFMTKPFDFERLAATVSGLVDARR
jgi:hypothetical protein